MKTLSFEGHGAEYFKIWIVNIMLTIITLGLYYPWAKVRNRRYFYGNTTLEGRHFDYHATGKQLFIGYLIAMAIFLIFILGQHISSYAPAVAAFIFVITFPWIMWRSAMFNLRMTSFSNVRFGFGGTLRQSYINFMLLPVAVFLPLFIIIIASALILLYIAHTLPDMSVLSGIFALLIFVVVLFAGVYAFAFLKKRQSSYIINGSRYGQGEFNCTLETKTLAKIVLKTIGFSSLTIIAIAVVVGIIFGIFNVLGSLTSVQQTLQNPESIFTAKGIPFLLMIIAFYGIMYFINFLIFAYFFTRSRAYIYKNSTLDNNITFSSTLRAREMANILTVNLLMIVCSLGLAFPWAQVRMIKLIVSNTHVDANNIDGYISQQEEKQSSLGEQIGDAFDIDTDIGF